MTVHVKDSSDNKETVAVIHAAFSTKNAPTTVALVEVDKSGTDTAKL